MSTDSDREINIYSIAVRYFEKAHEYLSAAKKHDRASIEYDALLSMAIVSYCGPFTKHYTGPDRKKSQLTFDALDHWTGDQRRFHERCIEIRDKALAHPDFEYNPTKFTEGNVFKGRQYSILDEDVDLKTFESVLDRVISCCHSMRANHKRSAAAKEAD